MSKRGGRGKVSHKGRRRHFTDEEDLKQDLEKAKREKEWREMRGEVPSDEEKPEADDNNDDSSSEEEETDKHKGVSGLIEVENPNRVQQKMKKVTSINLDADSGKGSSAQLSRREREEIAKQQDKLRYQKLHAEGKTDQARADLARLAIIRKEREDAAKKRDGEKKARELTAAAKARK